MNALNLTRINNQSPYNVWQTSEEDFNFESDFGVLYRVSFRIEQTIWQDGAYEFSIINHFSLFTSQALPEKVPSVLRVSCWRLWSRSYHRRSGRW